MGRIKEYMFSVAEKRGIDIEEVTDDILQEEMENLQEQANLRKEDIIVCIQTGVECGYPCLGNCSETGILIKAKI